MTSAANSTGNAVTPLSALVVPVVPPVERPAVQIPVDSDNHLKRKADADEIENETDVELDVGKLEQKCEEILNRHRGLRRWCAQNEVATTRRLSIVEADLKTAQKALSDAKPILERAAEKDMRIHGHEMRLNTDRHNIETLTERVKELEAAQKSSSNDAVLERIDKLTTLFNAVLAANAANVAAVAEAHNSVLTAYKSVFPTKSPKAAAKGK